MATEKSINELVLNKVESQSVYDYMLANDLVNDDELYFVDDNNKYYTKTEADTLLNTKASNSNVYSKTEADNKYLALSGGTMTGQFATYSRICKANDTDWLDVCGGSAWYKGAFLCVSGKDSDRAGEFILCAHNGTNFYELCGFPNGTLTWGGNNIATIVAQGWANDSNYVRFSNGLQICFQASNYGTNTVITYGAPFNALPGISVGANGFTATEWGNTNFKLQGSGYCAWIAVGWWK